MNEQDAILIDGYLAGDARAFEVLITPHLQKIFATCFRICQDEDDAHDITQEVCIKIMKYLPWFERKSAFTTWIYRIAYTESLQFLRSKKEYIDLEVIAPYLGISDEHNIDKQDTEILVRQSIEQLSEIDRSIVLFFYYDELKIREIAEIMDINENTIKTRLSRAKSFLKAHLEPLWNTSSKVSTKSQK